MQTSGWEGPFFIQMHYSPLQGCRGTLEKSYIFISFANPRSLTRVRLRSSRQRQEMAELWCTTAINVSQEGRHARWEEKKKTLAFGNAIRKQNFHKPHYVLALCYPSARSVYKYSTSTYNDCFCLFLFHSTATLHWVTCWSINLFFLFWFFMHQS